MIIDRSLRKCRRISGYSADAVQDAAQEHGKHDAVTCVDQDISQASDALKKTGRRGSTIPKSVMATNVRDEIIQNRDMIGGRTMPGRWRRVEAGEVLETRPRLGKKFRGVDITSSWTLSGGFDHVAHLWI